MQGAQITEHQNGPQYVCEGEKRALKIHSLDDALLSDAPGEKRKRERIYCHGYGAYRLLLSLVYSGVDAAL